VHNFQKRKLAYKSKRNWLSRVVLKTISNILHHWDYNTFVDRMARPTAALTNPVVEKSSATVLCLHCFGDNSERFKFCQHCGVTVDSAPLNPADIRIFDLEGLFNFPQQVREDIDNKFLQFVAYKASSQNSKAIASTMRAFEKFILSFGLARFASSRAAPRAFSVLDASDSEVVNFCIWKSLSGAGRTYLHSVQCPLLGENKFIKDCIKLRCEKMVSAENLRTGVISKLRAVFLLMPEFQDEVSQFEICMLRSFVQHYECFCFIKKV